MRLDRWPLVNPADMRHRVTIKEIVTSKNSDGSGTRNPFPLAVDVPASINPQRGRLFWQAQQNNASVDSEIIIRYLAGVKAKMQVVFGVRVFGIVSVVNPEERNLYLHLFCTEVNG